MARSETEVRVIPTVFDRLLDYEPNLSTEAPKSRLQTIREIKQAVRRDLEWLLNTRRVENEDLENLEEASKSLLTFGLTDFSNTGIKNPAEQKRLVKSLETAIKRFEPRFLNVRVQMETVNNADRALRFKIEAQLDLDPTPEPVAFDTFLEVGGNGFEVREI